MQSSKWRGKGGWVFLYVLAVHDTSCINQEPRLLPLITNCNYSALLLHKCREGSEALGLGAPCPPTPGPNIQPQPNTIPGPIPGPGPCGGPRAAPCCCAAPTGGGSIARQMAAAAGAGRERGRDVEGEAERWKPLFCAPSESAESCFAARSDAPLPPFHFRAECEINKMRSAPAAGVRCSDGDASAWERWQRLPSGFLSWKRVTYLGKTWELTVKHRSGAVSGRWPEAGPGAREGRAEMGRSLRAPARAGRCGQAQHHRVLLRWCPNSSHTLTHSHLSAKPGLPFHQSNPAKVQIQPGKSEDF